MLELIGKILGNYHLIGPIGRGGTANVYKAKDRINDRIVAVKVLAPQLAMDPKFRARFEREAKVLSELNHPNIMPVLDYGEAEGLIYIVMPLMRVGGLNDRLQDGPLEVQEGAKIIAQIASALQYAHDSGVIHRDVKPSNILIGEIGKAWLSDFGFAHVDDTNLSLTGSTLIGTPAYMAPEQVRGKKVSPVSDQYALGMVLYQICTSYLPYKAETPMAIAVMQAVEPLPRPRLLNPNIPDSIERILTKVLAKDPELRFDSVTEFSEAFQKALYEAFDPQTGKLRPGSVGQDPVTETFDTFSIEEKANRSWYTQRPVLILFLLLLLAIPLTYWGVTAFSPNGGTVNIEATVNALSTANAPAAGTFMAPGQVETAVKGTMIALLTQPGDGEISGPGTPNPDGAPVDGGELSPGNGDTTILQPLTPEVTATPTPNPSFSSTPTWTLTATTGPPPALTQHPTNTATSPPPPTDPPPPTQNPCEALSLGGFVQQSKSVTWSFENSSTSSITIASLQIGWPINNQRLDEVLVGSTSIWTEGTEQTSISIGGASQSVDAGSSKGITLDFKKSAVSSGYSMGVTTTNGCQVNSSN